tara:strand:- start:2411 stop:3010 length:600 start_codon:yes stop_codon:yes gene_type:complete
MYLKIAEYALILISIIYIFLLIRTITKNKKEQFLESKLWNKTINKKRPINGINDGFYDRVNKIGQIAINSDFNIITSGKLEILQNQKLYDKLKAKFPKLPISFKGQNLKIISEEEINQENSREIIKIVSENITNEEKSNFLAQFQIERNTKNTIVNFYNMKNAQKLGVNAFSTENTPRYNIWVSEEIVKDGKIENYFKF